MSCQCAGIEHEFNRKRARKDAARFRRSGPPRTTRMLIDALRTRDVSGATLMDIGGGVGAIQLALVGEGVREVTSVDASSAYVSAARELAREQGVRARISYVHGDFTEVADRLTQADIVTLDRVICCYDDVASLVSRSAECAARLYGVVYPRSNFMSRMAVALSNVWLRLNRSPMRTFLHAQEAVDALIRERGFTPFSRQTTAIWQVVAYQKH